MATPLLCIHPQPNIFKGLTMLCLLLPRTTRSGHLAPGSTLSLTQFLSGRLMHTAQSSTVSPSLPRRVVRQRPSSVESVPSHSASHSWSLPPSWLLLLYLSRSSSASRWSMWGSELGLSPHLFFRYAVSPGHPSQVHGLRNQPCLRIRKYIPAWPLLPTEHLHLDF